DRRQLLSVLLLFCTIAVLIALADRAPMHLEKPFPSVQLREQELSYQDGVMQRTLPGPYVYRIYIPYTVAALNTVVPSASPVEIDFFLKILILILCQFSFYRYLRLFFSSFIALTGVFILDILVAFSLSSIQGPSMIETSDLLNM